MEQDKLIREQIKERVWEDCQRKVRNVFFITRTDHDSIIYGVSGNHTLFATAELFADGTLEIIY